MIGRCIWRKRQSADVSSQALQPKRQPTPFKATITGDQNRFEPIHIFKADHFHIFQGAFPDAHSSSSVFVAKCVHRLPESTMFVPRQLIVFHQLLQRFAFKAS